MRKLLQPGSAYRLLNVAAYLTVALVGFVGWFAVVDPGQRWIAAGLLAVFTLLNVYYDTDHGRRHIHLYLALQTAVVVALHVFVTEESLLFNVLFFILSAQAMVCLDGRRAVPWIGLFGLITGMTGVANYGWVGLLYVLPNIGGYVFFGTFGGALRQAEADKQRSQHLLEELRAAQSQLQELAVAEERNRLAREMHDSLGHRLTVAVVQLEGAQRLIPTDPERAARMIGAMREQMREALADLRRTVAALRTPLADDLPLDAALTRLARTFQESTGLAVHLSLPEGAAWAWRPEGQPTVPEAQRLAIYRAAQEALTNAQRHAGARQVWLSLGASDGRLSLTIADDGRGFPPATDNGGFGLRGLRERAGRAGGEVRLETRAGGGAQVVVTLPLEPYARSHPAG